MMETDMETIEKRRLFLKAGNWEKWKKSKTEQRNKIPAPPLQKDPDKNSLLIDLIARKDITVGNMPLIKTIERRRSRRRYTGDPLSLEELSFLLWSTQGISKIITRGISNRNETDDGKLRKTLRTVPSAGARHPFETYLLINNVTNISPGIYRYLPLNHKICLIDNTTPDLKETVHDACYKQFIKKSAVAFIWTVIPYRSEWRYNELSPKLIAQDSGHLCQNLYLACESIGAGTCALGEYHQSKMDQILGVDGKDEFTIYIAPVGKVKS